LVGFDVYKIRSFSCEEFELSFHLLNDAGLTAARLKASGQPKQFPWIEAGKKPSYADMVKSQNVVLTGANRQKIGSKPVFANSAFRSSSRAQKNRFRKSVFDRISFPRRSVFDRLSWSNDKNRDDCSHGIISDHGVHQMQNIVSPRGHTN
jgi:hypothetical protein